MLHSNIRVCRIRACKVACCAHRDLIYMYIWSLWLCWPWTYHRVMPEFYPKLYNVLDLLDTVRYSVGRTAYWNEQRARGENIHQPYCIMYIVYAIYVCRICIICDIIWWYSLTLNPEDDNHGAARTARSHRQQRHRSAINDTAHWWHSCNRELVLTRKIHNPAYGRFIQPVVSATNKSHRPNANIAIGQSDMPVS